MKKTNEPLRNSSAELALFMRRVTISFTIILLLISILIAHLYQLQVISFENYRNRSNQNSTKIIPILPSRGKIFDRHGTPIAFNRTIYQLELVVEKVNNLKKTLDALRPLVDLTDQDIANFNKKLQNAQKLTSIPLKLDLTDVQQAHFAVNKFRFPGVEIKKYQHRYYPYCSTFTHVIGYVSKINANNLAKLEKQGLISNYAATNEIGQLGIERYYENKLHGSIGYNKVEVNNRGHIIRNLYHQLPESGKDIYLTIDLNLQQYINKLLTGNRAAVVVIDPRDSGILALVSNPSFNPNLFVEGISSNDYQNLLNDHNYPLINRVTQGLYPPASTVKPYIAVSALTVGVINEYFSIFDPGWWQLPGSGKRYRDWKHYGHGKLNIIKAIEESADTLFYQVAYDMGIDLLAEWMMKFGYGHYTGIDITEEHTGIMPTRNWKMKRFHEPWYPGDTIVVGIGQGYWTATPLQILKALVTLINNGSVYKPHLLLGTREQDDNIISYHQYEETNIGDPYSGFWEIAKDGMYGVANHPNGTARHYFANTPYKTAAKSGTAQVYSLKANEKYNVHKINERLRDHKWMTAFAPYDNPTVCVVVLLENGGIGPSAGTITRNILDYILLSNKKNA
ncbi:peptidoglycan DD-transpeptidase MrdA [Candidatus Palibaumannia cicadellinicola]|uniref:Peptidoglycan D,D-transpeptidase MrdA n=1 Tax=Baumannia cicadellinicola subsp. Homalodisca coagulata TaxID=374463 RepID=Q1LTM6_BAUCH|nr:peptidoglycan DD-transpeptidase MrdA [Candidatus Baumannia cicadellinicola]ABF14362.1 penicillin-binding protein 2 [Baumannia cicadellinicola str. Hc (Homalodisca coagulata)]MCJ7462329.1 peptidoglycan DD-transpeptidase MrdA [Candidatus Baumannia cicadellinicola]MCJ7462635.1 peptidoglycan DD-transpeptidase MrdA [Candidatus Baumannia cicadellinicola]